MWNRELYIGMIRKIVESGTFMGKSVKNKEELYNSISSLLFVSYDTVKSWTRKNSNGPGDASVLEKLEQLLGTTLVKENKQENVEVVVMKDKYSDFVKENVKRCYDMLFDYVIEKDIENEARYCQIRTEIRKTKIAIPQEIYGKIEAFADEYLDPIIYDDTYWDFLHTEELGHFDENGTFCLKDEKATLQSCGLFLNKVIEIAEMLETFGMRELYPLLTE